MQAAALGLPVVATDLLADELGWRNEVELMSVSVGDAAAFADAILVLHEFQDPWEALRSHALQRLQADYGLDGFVAAVRDVLTANDAENNS